MERAMNWKENNQVFFGLFILFSLFDAARRFSVFDITYSHIA